VVPRPNVFVKVGLEDGLITPCSCQPLLGYAYGELRGRPFETILAQRSRSIVRRVFDWFRAEAPGRRYMRVRDPLWGLTKDRRETPVDLTLVARARRRVLVGVDLVDALGLASPGSHGELLRTVAHELENATAALRLWGQVLAKPSASVPALRADRALGALATRLDRLIADVHDARDLAGGTLAVVPRGGLCARALVQGAAEAARPTAGSHVLRLAVARGLPPVCADEGRILQVLANLIDNAIKYAAKATITIGAKASPRGDQVTFFVRDEGPGMEGPDRARVFERGWRAPACAGAKPGSGLGLAISQAIVEAHGSTLLLASCPNAGSTFSFALTAERASDKR
jgi:signal transduction histidine kinase